MTNEEEVNRIPEMTEFNPKLNLEGALVDANDIVHDFLRLPLAAYEWKVACAMSKANGNRKSILEAKFKRLQRVNDAIAKDGFNSQS